MGDADRREVVQVPAVSSCPPDRQLKSSVLLDILPPAQDRGMVVLFPCSFLLSNGLVAIENHHGSFLLIDSKLEISL